MREVLLHIILYVYTYKREEFFQIMVKPFVVVLTVNFCTLTVSDHFICDHDKTVKSTFYYSTFCLVLYRLLDRQSETANYWGIFCDNWYW